MNQEPTGEERSEEEPYFHQPMLAGYYHPQKYLGI